MFTREDLAPFVADGWISETKHPGADLWIYNYTKRTGYERHWTPETLACRGLILDAESRIVARPMAKFFNLDERPDDPLPEGAFTVTEKLDGSLGIFYSVDGYGAVATRGSFTSDQAVKATEILRAKYDDWVPPDGVTPLFEILYPANRIVVDYGGVEDLVLLATIDNATGLDRLDGTYGWLGPVVSEFPAANLAPSEVLGALGIDDGTQEGFVLRFDAGHQRVKVKLDEYKRLHRILTGVSSTTIWEALMLGKSLDEVLDRLPDEMNAWLHAEADRQTELHASTLAATHDAYADLIDVLPKGFDRKAFAEAAMRQTEVDAGWLFMLLDGRDPSEKIWRRLKPEWTTPFWSDVDDG